ETELRSILGAFLFRGDDVFKSVSVLSGGERSRLALARTLLSPANVLVLDEPTNHLDIESREALVEALTTYPGAVILVSHDMHLLELVADRLWLVSNGTVTPFEDDLEAYRKLLLSDAKPAKDRKEAPAPKPKRPTREALLALKSEARKSEARVEKLNQMRDKLATKLADPDLYEDTKIGEMEVWQKKYAEVMEALDRAEALWMQDLEKLEAAEHP
ncbi:MAG: ATP-binding cassette domain-containing protein, partial [Pseudomonadota bacterium]